MKSINIGGAPLLRRSDSFRSQQGHTVQYSCVVVGRHLRRKVLEFAVSHGLHKAEALSRLFSPSSHVRS
jgi:hypothetical protein